MHSNIYASIAGACTGIVTTGIYFGTGYNIGLTAAAFGFSALVGSGIYHIIVTLRDE